MPDLDILNRVTVRRALKAFGMSALTILLVFSDTGSAFAWGSEGHRLITAKALEVLPPDLASFYSPHLTQLKGLCVEPDELWKDPAQWKGHPEWKDRSNWHFLDMDHFHFQYPFTEFPRGRAEADSLYARADSLYDGHGNAGYLPWTIQDYYRALVNAWRVGDAEGVIRNSGLLSHFAGDASMPLHLTRNYKGQYTGNIVYRLARGSPASADRSIHERFEIALVEKNLARYEKAVRPSGADRRRYDDILSETFAFIVGSYFHQDKITSADKIIMERLRILTQDKAQFDGHRDEYYRGLDRSLGGLAISRLRAGAVFLGDLWYSAWVEAGKPTLQVH